MSSLGSVHHHQRGLTRIEQAGRLQDNGMSIPEIAIAMGVSLRTVRVYLHGFQTPEVAGGPRCTCGLLLPCTCTRPMRVEDFLGKREETNVHQYNGRHAC